jgi:hypothetical protein
VILNLCWLGAVLLLLSMIFRNKDFAKRESVTSISCLKNKEIEISVNVEKQLVLEDNVKRFYLENN